MHDDGHWNKRDYLLKDIAFAETGITSAIPTGNTQRKILDLLKTKIALTADHRIKKRALSFQIN